MSYAIELMLDAQADAFVRQIWSDLATAGLGDDLDKLGAQPHISLAVWDEAVPEQLEAVRSWAEDTPQISVTLNAVAIWPQTGVVYLAATQTAALLETHSRLYKCLDSTAISVWDYYRPDQWVPHCTLAEGLERLQLAETVQHCSHLSLPVTATLETAAMVSFRPVESLHTWRLSTV